MKYAMRLSPLQKEVGDLVMATATEGSGTQIFTPWEFDLRTLFPTLLLSCGKIHIALPP